MDIVTIRTFDNYFNANIILTKLQDAGIECYLHDEFIATIDPVGGIKLVVRKEDKSAALLLIKQFDEEQTNNEQSE